MTWFIEHYPNSLEEVKVADKSFGKDLSRW